MGSANHGTFFRKHRNPENGWATTGTTAAANSYLSGAVAGNGNLDGTITPAHTSPRVFPKARASALCMAPEWLKGGVQVETFFWNAQNIVRASSQKQPTHWLCLGQRERVALKAKFSGYTDNVRIWPIWTLCRRCMAFAIARFRLRCIVDLLVLSIPGTLNKDMCVFSMFG